MTTENPPFAYAQFLHRRHSLHLQKTDSAFSSIPPQSATGGTAFSRLTVRSFRYSLLICYPSVGPDAACALPAGAFTPERRQKGSLSLPSGMTTVATGQVLLAGPSPAGFTASFAAPSEFCMGLRPTYMHENRIAS
jgi:hypothetical protein